MVQLGRHAVAITAKPLSLRQQVQATMSESAWAGRKRSNRSRAVGIRTNVIRYASGGEGVGLGLRTHLADVVATDVKEVSSDRERNACDEGMPHDSRTWSSGLSANGE